MFHYFTLISLCVALLSVDSFNVLPQISNVSTHITSAIYKQFMQIDNGNFVFSPLSAQAALVSLHSGANGAAAEEIRRAFQIPHSQAIIKAFREGLGKEDDYLLNWANKIYVNNSFRVKVPVHNVTVDPLAAQAENIDFSQPEKATDAINRWVEDRTGNSIKNLVRAGDLNNETSAVSVNALHFEGNWTEKFANVSQRGFFVKGHKTVQVDTITNTNRRLYYNSQKLNAQFLELPFRGDEVVMTFVLPNEKDGLRALEERLDEVFTGQRYVMARVTSYLPKFKSESGLDFKGSLMQSKVKAAFGAGPLRGGMLQTSVPILINGVLLKTSITVNENGVGVAPGNSAKAGKLIGGTVLNLDHPFIYFIRFNNVILLAGRVVDPTQ